MDNFECEVIKLINCGNSSFFEMKVQLPVVKQPSEIIFYSFSATAHKLNSRVL